ncbi:MAG TPA: sulfatase-like hydrolase/transferase [Bryobacteraceae bacterium]
MRSGATSLAQQKKGKAAKIAAAKPKGLSRRAQIGLICGIAQWILLLGIQTGNFFGYLLPPMDRDLSAGSYLFTAILFIQAQNGLISALIGFLAYACAGNVISRWIFFVFYCVECAYLLIDQVYYKVFLDHVRLGAFEGGQQFNAAITLSSFTHELDGLFYFNAVLALAGIAWLAWALVAPQSRPKRSRLALELGAVLLLIGLPAFSSKKYGHLNENPVLALGRELQQGSVENFLAKRASGSVSAAASEAGATDHDPRLAAFLAGIRMRHPHPNLVLIVLESVGEQNLFGSDGLPSAVYTPTLAKLAAGGATLDTLYTTFPGTTRSLLTLHSGGRQITYSGVAPFYHPYQGPLLARAIGDVGYKTALFSGERLDGEGSDVMLKQGSYDKFYDFAEDLLGHEPANFIHSWGAREEYTQTQIQSWLRDQSPASGPFYLEYMNAATHHPYGAPPDFHSPLPPDGDNEARHADYLNALNYTDRSIAALLDYLEQRGLLKNTVIAVTGDHGEAFGDRHPNNFLHKNFIYEENVRDYLILMDGEQYSTGTATGAPLRSSRIASTGDIMPTLLALVDAPAADVPGRNLLTEDFQTHVVYFHKLAEPESWGLRDGPWKYIGEIRSGAAQLYNLTNDPLEQHNLAGQQADRVARYAAMCLKWYLESDREYTLRVQDYTASDSRLNASAPRLGAQVLATGFLTGEQSQEQSFVASSLVNPRQALTVWTKWTRDPDPTESYEWIAPGGQAYTSKPGPGPEFHVTVSGFPGPVPMEEGAWTVRLHERDGVYLTGKFTVRAGAAIHGK